MTGAHAIVAHRLEAEGPEFVGAAVHILGLDRAGRGHERNAITGLETARAVAAALGAAVGGNHAKPAISAATS